MKPFILPLSLLLATGVWAKSKEAERIEDAATALTEIMGAPDKGIPKNVLGRTHCVAVIPSMKKLAVGFGGQHGKGLVSCRKAGGGWGPPSMLALTGGSFGLQLGAQATDVFMLIMNKRGIDYLTKDKFEVGGDLSAAAGPVGREATANTDVALRAEIYTYSRSKGLFAGVSLKGASVRPDKDANRAIYGHPVEARELLLEGSVAPPADAQPFIAALDKYAGR